VSSPLSTLISTCLVLSCLTAGCTKRVALRALEPSGIPRAASLKRISVSELEHDELNIGSKLEVKLSALRVRGEPYFTVVSRADLGSVLDEQRLQGSGLVDPAQAVQPGALLGAYALISGSVGPQSLKVSRYTQERSKCVSSDCKKKSVSVVNCRTLKAQLALQLKLVDVRGGDIVYGHQDQMTREWSLCEDEVGALPDGREALSPIADELLDRFVALLAPREVTYLIEIIDELDVTLSPAATERFEGAVHSLEERRYQRAQGVLESLAGGEGAQSAAVLYNLGLSVEASGALQDALRLYERADQLSPKPLHVISRALDRVKRRLQDQAELTKQLESK